MDTVIAAIAILGWSANDGYLTDIPCLEGFSKRQAGPSSLCIPLLHVYQPYLYWRSECKQQTHLEQYHAYRRLLYEHTSSFHCNICILLYLRCAGQSVSYQSGRELRDTMLLHSMKSITVVLAIPIFEVGVQCTWQVRDTMLGGVHHMNMQVLMLHVIL